MESGHFVRFSTSGKFITKFNVLRCISFKVEHYFGQGEGVEYQSPLAVLKRSSGRCAV